MRRIRHLSRGGRLLLAIVVGSAVFGIATAVQASIPDASGVIHGCYNTSLAHGNPTGGLRVIDTAKINGNCASWEAPLNWNQTGPTGARGPTGPAGPTFLATGLVYPDGTVSFTTGPLPTITHTVTGQYGFTISGIGTACPLPQLTGYYTVTSIYFGGGVCGGGFISTTVFTGDGTDEYWNYMVVGDPPSGAATTKMRALPTR